MESYSSFVLCCLEEPFEFARGSNVSSNIDVDEAGGVIWLLFWALLAGTGGGGAMVVEVSGMEYKGAPEARTEGGGSKPDGEICLFGALLDISSTSRDDKRDGGGPIGIGVDGRSGVSRSERELES